MDGMLGSDLPRTRLAGRASAAIAAAAFVLVAARDFVVRSTLAPERRPEPRA